MGSGERDPKREGGETTNFSTTGADRRRQRKKKAKRRGVREHLYG